MMDNNDVSLVGIDPLLQVDVKLFIKDILSLVANDYLKGFFKFYQHSIQNAEICGCVVAIDKKGVSAIYTVDDGTGTIECTFEHDISLQNDPVRLGDCVRVAGMINEYRECRELRAHSMALVGPNEELMHNVQVLYLKKEYRKPYEVPLQFKSMQKELAKQLTEEEMNLGLVISDTQEVKTDKSYFSDVLLEFLRTTFTNQSVFSLTVPLGNEGLKVLAREVMINSDYNPNPTVKQVSQFFFQNLQSLQTKGHIIQTDQKGQLYKVVDEELLRERVIRIIQELLDSKKNYIGGVTEEYIIAKFQAEQQTPFPSDRIIKLLNDLVVQSVLWESSPGEYQIL